jgi:hypothetical protein
LLIALEVENHLSIKEKVVLSLVASSDKTHEKNLITTGILGKDRLVRSAAVYGPNASGKSNVIYGLAVLKYLVESSHKSQKGDELGVTPFKLDKQSASKPTTFEVVFIAKGVKHQYRVTLDNKKVINERLYWYPRGRRSLVFDRRDTDDYRFTIDKRIQRFISRSTLENALYLSTSTRHNYGPTAAAFEWFRDGIRVVGPGDHISKSLERFVVEEMNKSPRMKKAVLKAMAVADMGISDLSASMEKIDFKVPIDLGKIPPADRDEVRKLIEEASKMIRIRTTHIAKDVKEMHAADFDFESEESEGTKRYFALAGAIIDCIQSGGVLVVDELDVKLHNHLVRHLVQKFHNPQQNKRNAQLIFSTHNLSLLSLDLFRRDQIWFTERNRRTGATDLYSLAEFSPRKEENVLKAYLAGRYGATPFIQNEGSFL